MSARARVRRASALAGALVLLSTTAARAQFQTDVSPEASPEPPREEAAAMAPLARTSRAEPQWELAGKATYGAPPVRGGTSPFGPGFGGRLGLSIADVYLGASVVDYLGATDVDAWAHGILYGGEIGYGIRTHESDGVFFVIRPQLGVGGLTVFHTTPNTSTAAATTSRTVRNRAAVDVITTASGGTSSSGSSGSASNVTTTTVSNVYLQPGVTMMVSGKSTFAGVNANVLVIPGLTYGDNAATTWVSYGVEGQLGVRF